MNNEKPYLVACICRKEEQYIEEFVKYHLNLGFDKVIIGDNNDIDQNNYEEILKEYIQEGSVEIVNLRGQLCQQLPFYNRIINNYSYRWCAFIDCDEFITFSDSVPREKQNIKEFLIYVENSHVTYNAVRLNWMCYGSNGLIYNDKRPVLERFTTPNRFDFKFQYPFPENFHTKIILHEGTKYKNFCENPHTISGMEYIQPTNFIQVDDGPFNVNMDLDTLYIRHFYTKSFQEWVEKKMEKRTADMGESAQQKTIENYIIYNPNDAEKVKEVLNNGSIKLIY